MLIFFRLFDFLVKISFLDKIYSTDFASSNKSNGQRRNIPIKMIYTIKVMIWKKLLRLSKMAMIILNPFRIRKYKKNIQKGTIRICPVLGQKNSTILNYLRNINMLNLCPKEVTRGGDNSGKSLTGNILY